jgi:hypothetical protein
MVDREIGEGLDDVRNGRVHSPYSASQAAKFLKAELKTRLGKANRNVAITERA